MHHIYQLTDRHEDKLIYLNKDLRCVIHYLLTKEREWLSNISEEDYLNAQFNLNQPYLNNIRTWNKILYPDGEIIKIKVNSDVFNEDEKVNMPNLIYIKNNTNEPSETCE